MPTDLVLQIPFFVLSQLQFSALSTGDSSKYDEQQERKEQALRSTVSAIRAKHGDCSLEFVEQDMTKEIDVGKEVDVNGQKSENMILEHLLEMEVHQSEEVARLVATVQEVGFIERIIHNRIACSFTTSLNYNNPIHIHIYFNNNINNNIII